MRLPSSFLLAAAAAVLASPARADDADDPSVVPYRPSVSTPAQLSAPGWLELEAGGLRATGPGGPALRSSVPYTLKLAFSPDWGVRVGGDAWARQADGTNAASGGGDTTVVLKRRFAIDDASAAGLELGQKFATAGPTLGSGRPDTSLTAIWSSDFAPKWHADLNLGETRVGLADRRDHGWLTGWAAAVSRQVTDAWGVVGEFSGTHQRGAGDSTQFLLAASWQPAPAVVFDAGVARGLTSASTHDQVFAGLTVRLARIFHAD